MKIQLRNDDTGESSDWHVEKVVITDPSDNDYRFPANVWLSHDAGRELSVDLYRGKHLFL